MRHIKLFEDFDQDPDLDPTVDQANKQKVYHLFILSKEGEDLDAEVRDEDGKSICKVDQEFLDDGRMQHENDISGLRDYLIDKKKIKQQDVVTLADSGQHDTGEEMGSTSGHQIAQLTIPIV